MSEDTSTPENTTTTVATVMTIDELTAELATAKSQQESLNVQLETVRTRRDYWEKRFQSGQDDWNTLNEHIKGYADEQNLCAQFEDKIAEWNLDYKVFQLEGRVRSYDVSVKVEATYYTTVTVEATSPEAAQEKVEEMDSDEIDNNSGLNWKYPEDIEFNVTYVEES